MRIQQNLFLQLKKKNTNIIIYYIINYVLKNLKKDTVLRIINIFQNNQLTSLLEMTQIKYNI